MNIIELEPARIHELNLWWMKPEAGQLIACLEMSAKKSTMEFAALTVNARAEADNPNYQASAQEKLQESVEFQHAIKVLKSFFPDGPFIARIEL